MRLNKNHHTAIRVLALGGTRKQAAEAAGCSETTIYKWLKDKSFDAELERVAADSVRDSLRGWKTLQRYAVQRTQQMLSDPDTPPAVVATLIKAIVDRLPTDTPPGNVLIIPLDSNQRVLIESQFGSMESAAEQFAEMIEAQAVE